MVKQTCDSNDKRISIMHNEELYLKKFLDPLKICKKYKPKFGKGNKEEGLDLNQFISLYAIECGQLKNEERKVNVLTSEELW